MKLVDCSFFLHTKTTTVLQTVVWDYAGELVPEEIIWTFMVPGKMTEADTWTIRLGATPPGLISDPSPISPDFYMGCSSCHNSPTLFWPGTGTKYAGLHTQWQYDIIPN